MGNMRFKVGDRVRIKSLDWYNENKNNKGIIVCGSESFTHPMSYFCNKVVNIITIQDDCYRILEDDGDWYWTDEMIEGLVEDVNVSEFKHTQDEIMKMLLQGALNIPEGYCLRDQYGNIINAKYVTLEKKKREYPKTYEECCEVLGYDDRETYCVCHTYANERLFESLYRLKVCRDAYWKIAGDEMGLGRPWELSIGIPIYYIYYNRTLGTIKKDYADDIQGNVILAFPTAEMRDAFYENFKELINSCKELL